MKSVNDFLDYTAFKNPNEPEFLQEKLNKSFNKEDVSSSLQHWCSKIIT